jgi:tripartite-type tricarboxylate transporter receptor subunit TctC
MLTRAGTRPEVVNRLNGELRKVLDEPEVRTHLLNQGAEPMPMSPEEFSRYIAAELQKWARVVKETGARLD